MEKEDFFNAHIFQQVRPPFCLYQAAEGALLRMGSRTGFGPNKSFSVDVPVSIIPDGTGEGPAFAKVREAVNQLQ